MAKPQPTPRVAEPLGTATRRAALRLLDAVLRRGEALETALPAAARALHGPDRGLAHAIAAETLRWLPDVDALIDGATRLRLADDAKARMALRIALVQVLVLGTPEHAAIATVLPLVDGGPRRLVHGVFGTLSRNRAALPAVPTMLPGVAARWEAAWGAEVVAAASRALAARPPLDLSFAADPQEWREALGGTPLATRHLRLNAPDAVPDLAGFAEGAWWVQDIAASVPARLIGAGPGAVLDLCAAPGGKTCQLAAAGWQVTAVDQSESRLARLSDNLARTHLSAETVVADVLDWSPAAPADAVLVDAPCSATGIFRRHPDVLHRAHPALIADMAALQRRLLARAADWVRPGGTLVYATCSLEREEGEEQLDSFLAERADYAIDPPREGELPPGIVATGQGVVRTLPGTLAAARGCDGFFVVRLRRQG